MPNRNGKNPLTERQQELVAFVASGKTIEQAAEECFIARQSAYNVLSAARNKTGAKTIAQLAVMAVIHGWVEATDRDDFAPAGRVHVA